MGARRGALSFLSGFGLYLATIIGMMTLAMLRLQAWRRANPWTPPEPPKYAPLGDRLRLKTQ